jgi:hypothetical protein
MEHDTYSFNSPWQALPSRSQGRYITDAIYMHGGSWALWSLDKRFNRFTTRVIAIETALVDNIKPVTINGQEFPLWSQVDIPLDGSLRIDTQHGAGTHLAFEVPTLHVSEETPDIGPLFDNPT